MFYMASDRYRCSRFQLHASRAGIIAIALLIGLLLPAAVAERRPAAASGGGTIRATTRLVVIHVEATDHAGNPVSGLTRDDFQVLDNHVAQNVQVFRVENVEAETNFDESVDSSLPGTFTNQRKRAGRELRIIVMDPTGLGTWNPSSFDYENGWDFIRRVLAQSGPDDAVAVYEFSDRMLVRHEFSDTYDRLPRTIPSTLEQRARVDMLESQFSASYDPHAVRLPGFEDARSTATANMVESNFTALVRHLAGVPGRKHVLYVGGPIPLNPMSPVFDRIRKMLNDADIALYPVDTRVPGEVTLPFEYTGNWTSWVMAGDTGGEPFMPKDPAKVADVAWQRQGAHYVLGYYPRHDHWNGEYRQLSITVNHPDVKLSYRKGYYAGGKAMSSTQERDALLQSIAYSPADATGLPLRVQAQKVSQKPLVRLTLLLRPEDISFVTRDGGQSSTLDLLYQEQTTDTQALLSKVETLEIPPARPGTRPRFLGVRRELKLAPKTEQIRVIVRDRNSGAIGSVYIPLNRIPAR